MDRGPARTMTATATQNGAVTSKTIRWADPLVLAAFALLSAAIVLLSHGWLQDDAFITYQVARNFATGHGLVFNAGQRYLSTSGPLYAILLGLLGMPRPDAIPVISEFLSGVALFATAGGLLKLGRFWERPLFGAFAGTLYLALPTVWGAIGFESLPQVALVVWSTYYYFLARQRRSPAIAAGGLLALAVLMRPDGLLAAAALLAYAMAGLAISSPRDRWNKAEVFHWRAILTFLAPLALAAILATAYYGSPLPGTMQAKVAQVLSGRWQPFTAGFVKTFGARLPTDYPWLKVCYLGAVVGAVGIWLNRRAASLLLWPIAHALAFSLGHLPSYGWYFVPESLALAVLGGHGLSLGYELLKAPKPLAGRVALAASACLIAATACFQLPAVRKDRDKRIGMQAQSALYPRVGRWLLENTAPQDRIGYYEVGLLAWYSHRRFVDPLGLVTPGQAQNVQAGRFDAAYIQQKPEVILQFMAKVPPEYLAYNKGRPWISEYRMDPVDKPWFVARYSFVTAFEYGSKRIEVYRLHPAPGSGATPADRAAPMPSSS